MINTSVIEEINYLTNFRKKLHQFPELSDNEKQTAQAVVDELKLCNPTTIITKLGGHGVAAIFKGSLKGDTILFRAELDALPIIEENTFEHASQYPGISHKCGHDGHATILIGLARILKLNPLLKGEVILLFQPAEENGNGAKAVLEDEKFKSIKPDFVFALHNVPDYDKGAIIIKTNSFTPSVTSLKITLKGKNSHAAEPENGINPDLALQELIVAIKALADTNIDNETFSVITTVYATLGSKDYGISADYAELHFTIRCWTANQLNDLKEIIATLIKNISKKHQLKYTLDWIYEFDSNNNNDKAVDYILKAAESNSFNIIKKPTPFKWGEDFGTFTQQFKGAMFGLGSGVQTPALHNPDYDFPDEITPYGVQMFYTIIKLMYA
ncbi:amidohydrolase [Lutibacter oceani]|uniref:Amidohydrolase n=1 Tax=Lutibacter oceani TaxID=1853311 RepID=A0A3D9RL38_9FLAO|nr:amidohydrolase [Lutibacter oceani]REE80590.1 amidohydrolase [Lutibacter oceani]